VEIPLDSNGEPLGGQLPPEEGCIAELTKLRLGDTSVWWTLGLEAFGTIWTVERNLKLGAEVLAGRSAPPLCPAVIASYPAWLGRHLT
jgi:hypothetical protein